MVEMVVGREPTSDLAQWHTHAVKVRAHGRHRTWPAEVDE